MPPLSGMELATLPSPSNRRRNASVDGYWNWLTRAAAALTTNLV